MDTKNTQQEQKTPPYLSFATFLNALNALAEHGIPGIIDRSVLKQFSGLNQRLLLNSFRFMGFTNEDDAPTEKLKEYAQVSPEKRKEILGSLLKSRFIKQTDILPNGTPNQLRDAFNYITVEPSVKAKIIAFFIQAAKEAGYNISPHILRNTRIRAPKAPGMRKPSKNGVKGQGFENPPIDYPPQELEGMTRMPIPMGPDKIWYVVVNKNYTKEEVDRFIKILGIVLEKV